MLFVRAEFQEFIIHGLKTNDFQFISFNLKISIQRDECNKQVHRFTGGIDIEIVYFLLTKQNSCCFLSSI